MNEAACGAIGSGSSSGSSKGFQLPTTTLEIIGFVFAGICCISCCLLTIWYQKVKYEKEQALKLAASQPEGIQAIDADIKEENAHKRAMRLGAEQYILRSEGLAPRPLNSQEIKVDRKGRAREKRSSAPLGQKVEGNQITHEAVNLPSEIGEPTPLTKFKKANLDKRKVKKEIIQKEEPHTRLNAGERLLIPNNAPQRLDPVAKDRAPSASKAFRNLKFKF